MPDISHKLGHHRPRELAVVDAVVDDIGDGLGHELENTNGLACWN
jgi:hypothetical protein